jgi:DNA-binding response OmpR family regulator
MSTRLLLITDRADLAHLLAQTLIHSGFAVVVLSHSLAQNKTSATDLENYALILLHLFESDNVDLCCKLRDKFHSPILALLYEQDERFLLRTYEAGADDCLMQPMSIHLLVAKVQAWLRRSGLNDNPCEYLEAYDFRFNTIKSEVITPEKNLVRLTQLEARLLHLLIANSGSIVTTDLITQRVWPDNAECDRDRHLLKALVHRLRRKIEAVPARPQYIHTIPQQGYRFRPR